MSNTPPLKFWVGKKHVPKFRKTKNGPMCKHCINHLTGNEIKRGTCSICFLEYRWNMHGRYR